MSPQQNPKKKYNQFEAVILAGGRGSRLSPLTDFCPKPLLKVKGNSLLEYITDEVNFCGIDNITIATNYLSEQIHEQFSERYKCVKTNFETMVESFIYACGFSTKEHLLCLSADALITKNSMTHTIDNYLRTGSDISLTLTETDRSRKKWKYSISEEGFLQDLSILTSDNNLERSGLVMSRHVISSLEEGIARYGRNYLGFGTGWNLILRLMLDQGKKIYVSRENFPIFNINTQIDLDGAESFVTENLR